MGSRFARRPTGCRRCGRRCCCGATSIEVTWRTVATTPVGVNYPGCVGAPPTVAGDVGRKVDVDELVGAAEIARRLKVSGREVVNAWRRRDNRGNPFPEPVAELEMGNVWAWADVEAWARRTGRL